MKRFGKHFESGYPCFYRRIEYSFLNNDVDYETLLKEKREELSELLLPRVEKYMDEFGVKIVRPTYPYSQIGKKGLTLHIGNNERSIQIWKTVGQKFLNHHNLDSYLERMVCFNIGSDVLEYLDADLLAPRVFMDDNGVEIRYQLPNGMKVIKNKLFNCESVLSVYELCGLDTEDVSLTLNDTFQKIESFEGKIEIFGGACEGRGFCGHAIPRASFAISKIMYLCQEW
ncbi:hypothetical protein GOV12_07340 [Candidatus Pacearchaeota archaeon]|nr:hypothetical protein [Candidatus Pacearchaeota archaeon]